MKFTKFVFCSAVALGFSANLFAMDIDLSAGQPAISSGTSLSIKNTRISNYSFPVTTEFAWDGSTNSLKLVDIVQEPNPDSIVGKWAMSNDPGCSGTFNGSSDFTVNADGTCETYIPCKWTLKDGHIEIVWPSVPQWLYAGELSQGALSGKITNESNAWGCWKATKVQSLLTRMTPVSGGASVPPRR